MTCIVGIEFKDAVSGAPSVMIAGDKQATGWNSKVFLTHPKVFKKNGILFGFCGSARYGQLLEHELANPIAPQDPKEVYRWLVTVLVPGIRETMKQGGMDTVASQSLIGVHGQLWQLQSDFSVLRCICGYDAIGSGTEYAFGSLATSLRNELSDASAYEDALRHAIRVAGTFSPSVGLECTVLT